MALQGFTRGGSAEDATDYDPFFYRGKSPVLGRPVEIKAGGELPAEFPSAGAVGPAPTAPTPPGSGPGFPAFPGFNFDFGGGEPPTPPTVPNFDILGPGGQRAPWWGGVTQSAETIGQASKDLRKLQNAGINVGRLPDWANPGQFSLFGPDTGQWWGAPGEPTFSVTGPESTEALDPSKFNLGGDAASKGASFSNLAGPALQFGGGLYGAVSQKPGSLSQVSSSVNALGGALGLAGGLSGIEALSVWSPVTALLSLPLVAGSIYENYFAPDKARWPKGYQFIPGSSKSGGSGAMAVDPATGAVLVYRGNGHYEWAEATRSGVLPKPEDFVKWEITPSGELAKRAGYGQIGTQLRDLRLSPERRSLAPGSGGATTADIRSLAEQQRAPAIDQIKAANPGLSEGEIWRRYTISPEYQDEQNRMAQYANTYTSNR